MTIRTKVSAGTTLIIRIIIFLASFHTVLITLKTYFYDVISILNVTSNNGELGKFTIVMGLTIILGSLLCLVHQLCWFYIKRLSEN